jgi:hypothetical protein
MHWRLLFFLVCAAPLFAAPKVVHIYAALCDNASQGIQRVPEKIGNGDDPEHNLYWGCDDGVRSVFRRSKSWKRMSAADPDGDGPVLERLVSRHVSQDVWLVADAYRGREIKTCLTDYFAALAGSLKGDITAGDTTFAAAGAADLIVYAGHDGLMEFEVPVPAPVEGRKPKAAIALCCVSRTFFQPHLEKQQVQPLLLTTQLMYPAAQCLHESIGGWLAGKSGPQCLQLAAAAYAANQGISPKAAAGVFHTAVP